MRKPNGGVIFLLISGAAAGFALSLVLSSMLLLNYLIPVFILLVICGYLTARVIGRAGGEFSEHTKNYSIILVGLMFGIVFDLMRFRYDWIINVFKYIAIGTFFILVTFVLKRNLQKYSEIHPNDGPYLGLMRPSLMWILVGVNFAISINCIAEAFLGAGFFMVTLPILAVLAVAVILFSRADYDLLESESGIWNQLFSGGVLGITYDLILFRVLFWQDLLKLFIVCMVFAITATVIRMKKPVKSGIGEINLELEDKKSRKAATPVGKITLESRIDGRRKSPSQKKKR